MVRWFWFPALEGTLPGFPQWYAGHDEASVAFIINDTVTTATTAAAAAAAESTTTRAWTQDEMRGALLFPALTYLNLDNNRVVRKLTQAKRAS